MDESFQSKEGYAVPIEGAALNGASRDQRLDDNRRRNGRYCSLSCVQTVAVALWRRIEYILHRKALPDDKFTIFGWRIVNGPPVIRLLKFLSLTYLSFFVVYGFVRWVDWEHDPYYDIEDFWKHDSAYVITDGLFFFMVGRLYKRGGVDHLAWFLTVLSSTLFYSGLTQLDFMQHSISLYEMHCEWPPGLWIFAVFAVIIVCSIVIAHVRRIHRKRLSIERLLEIAFCLVFFLAPYVASPFFHFHHWFAGWLLGMHFNLDAWWSRLAMAFCWGLYVNGIAVYGRDPILACQYSFYLSSMQGCSYMRCYYEGIEQGAGNATSNYTGPVIPHVSLDWRTCTERY